MTHLSLFSGIGGIDLAAHWAGFRTVAFVECDPFCQKVLAKNFPGIPIFDDVRDFDAEPFRGTTLISGGFPCQDISCANPKGQGLDGDRSGLFYEFLRIIEIIRPVWVLAENVPNLRVRGADRVLSELEEIGYAARALVVAAGNAGAPHIRKRVFVVANTHDQPRLQADQGACAIRGERHARHDALRSAWGIGAGPHWAVHQPPVCGVDARLPSDVDRLRALGNAVVPQQVYPILAAIAKEAQA